MPGRKRARADELHQSLRTEILAGRLEPGRQLKFSELCDRYDSSVGVVREVLTRLTEQGLVRSRHHHGFEVTPLSVEDLGDLTVSRLEIEGLVLGHAVDEGDVSWEADVVATHHTLERTPISTADDPTTISEAWAAAHTRFHQALLGGCTHSRLRQAAESLRQAAELYRRWALPLGHEPDRDGVAEHRSLLDAALYRDRDTAVRALQTHIAHTAHQLAPTVAEYDPRIAALTTMAPPHSAGAPDGAE